MLALFPMLSGRHSSFWNLPSLSATSSEDKFEGMEEFRVTLETLVQALEEELRVEFYYQAVEGHIDW